MARKNRTTWGWVLAGVMTLLLAGVAAAQLDTVTVQVQREHTGLGGWYRPGSWMPVLLTLENKSGAPRRVICEWSLADADGDQAQYRRATTLGPQSRQQLWLYAQPPYATKVNPEWQVRVLQTGADANLDTRTGQLLARQQLVPPQRIEPEERAVGIVGPAPGLLGLRPYTECWTQQESCKLIAGLSASTLPDRWYGLALLQALIWTPQAGDPDAADVPEATRQALREWVRRGGHLVLLFPPVGDYWTNSSLRDLLPVRQDQVRRVAGVPLSWLPLWLGFPARNDGPSFTLRWFAVGNENDPLSSAMAAAQTTVLLRGRDSQPLVVAGQYGLGRVTLIGIDLTDPRLTRMNLPDPSTMNPNPVGTLLWPTVFGWRGPVFQETFIQRQIQSQEKHLADVRYRRHLPADQFLPPLVALQETLTPLVFLALFIFGGYWLIAGPITFMVLQRQGRPQYNWLAFVGMVAVFSILCWGGALAFGPVQERVAHFSVVDIDAGSGLVRVHSWLSLFEAQHGRPEIALRVAQDADSDGNTLADPGIDWPVTGMMERGGFIDPQAYTVNAGAPERLRPPLRATAKQFEADYVYPPRPAGPGARNEPAEENGPPWNFVLTGQVRMVDGQPMGRLVHHLPGNLRDVLVVYCPGAGREPRVWRHGEWKPDEELTIARAQNRGQLLVIPPVNADAEQPQERLWRGHLGDLLRSQPLQDLSGRTHGVITLADDRRIQLMEMLTFYGTLPPPDYRETGYPTPAHYDRSVGRPLDLSALLALRRVIVLGHLDARERADVPLPLPLTVNGREVPARGWTMVRWVVSIE